MLAAAMPIDSQLVQAWVSAPRLRSSQPTTDVAPETVAPERAVALPVSAPVLIHGEPVQPQTVAVAPLGSYTPTVDHTVMTAVGTPRSGSDTTGKGESSGPSPVLSGVDSRALLFIAAAFAVVLIARAA